MQNVIERAIILSTGSRLDLLRALPQAAVPVPPAEADADAGAARILNAHELAALERANLERAYAVLEGHVASAEFVAAGQFSIADYAVAAVLHMVRTRAQIELPAYPCLARYLERITARPAWKRALADVP